MSVKIKGLTFHWTDSGSKTTVEDIRRWHVKGNGWKDIGYHRVILHPDSVPDAEEWWDLVKLGRKLNNDPYMTWDEVGAHTKGFNTGYVGIAVVGGPKYSLHPLQHKAILEAGDVLLRRFGLKWKDVRGHRDFNATQCPGDEIYGIIQKTKDWRQI